MNDIILSPGMNLFLPINKVDVAQRLVYGLMTEERPDKAGEMFDYASGKEAVIEWSEAQFAASGGKSKGNVREMHSPKAAGKIVDLVFDDEAKKIHVAVKVVDDDSWNKVLEGVLTGFSIGGGYVKRWLDPQHPGVTRYTPRLSEMSLVDNPCVHNATFEVIKEDGTSEMRKFNSQTKGAVMTTEELLKAAKEAVTAGNATDEQKELVKAAAAADDAKPDDSFAQNKDGVAQKWLAKDGSPHDTKAQALRKNIEIDAQEAVKTATSAVTDAITKMTTQLDKAEAAHGITKTDDGDDEAKKAAKKKEEEAAAEKVAKEEKDAAEKADKEKADKEAADKKKDGKKGEKAKKFGDAGALRKGLYEVSRFACLINELEWLQQCVEGEANWEKDNSPIPKEIKGHIAGLLVTLKAMLEEETKEMFADDGEMAILEEALAEEDEPLAMSIGTGALAKFVKTLIKDATPAEAHIRKSLVALEKKGAKISADNKKHLDKMMKSANDHLETMTMCMKDMGCMAGDDDAKKNTGGDLAKFESLTAENAELRKTVEAIPALIQGVTKRLEHLEGQPMPAKGVVTAVSKADDGGVVTGDSTKEQVVEAFSKMTSIMSQEEVSRLLMKAALRNGVQVAK